MSYNESIAIILNNIAYRYPHVGDIAVFCGEYLPYILGIIMIVFIAVGKGTNTWALRARITFIGIMAGLAARFAVKSIILIWITSPRPYVALADIHALIAPVAGEAYRSFPSGHTLFFFAVAAVVWGHNRWWGMVFFIGATLMGIGRVMVGVHYLGDVIVGAVLGIMMGACAYGICMKSKK